jgi:hypothetical protein
MPQVLNADLYARLTRAFGSVVIANEGVAMFPEPVSRPDIFNPGKWRLDVQEPGEQYRVSCPYCNDTRHRLYVSHRYGTKCGAGRWLNFLVKCWNEDCYRERANRDEFEERMTCPDSDLETATIGKGKVIHPINFKVQLPGECTNLRDLEPNHKARRYVEGRGLDPDRLGRYYGVGFCGDSIWYLARNRLFIPIYWREKLVGWQVRYLGELPWKDPAKKEGLPPKYWTMPGLKRGQILCNFDHARHFRTGVLVEGWFDVFAFGPMAMAVLGNTVSEQQTRVFTSFWGKAGRSGVWLLDPEEFEAEANRRLVAKLRGVMGKRFAAVKLPPGTDPGSLDRDFCRAHVAEQAARQGVKVYYERVS